MCYISNININDAPLNMNVSESEAWVIGYESGFDKAMEIVAKRDAGEDL